MDNNFRFIPFRTELVKYNSRYERKTGKFIFYGVLSFFLKESTKKKKKEFHWSFFFQTVEQTLVVRCIGYR